MPYHKLKRTIALLREEDERFTFAEIEEGVYFRGHNLWLLVLSMAIASIGLNINSPAAVIGAMLISPLMGPVVGLSFGLSIHNKNLVKLSLYNWVIMIITSLVASTIYFLISPFHQETSQLAAFKEATIFDCMLALFGGFAWFLGIIRKEAIKVIAGVAVATACIPPLCTAGYGIANLNWDFFFGGMYYYLINCFFIGVGTWILSIVLGYQKYYLEKVEKRNKKDILIITIISLLVLFPSILLTQKKWNAEKLKSDAEEYIDTIQKQNPELAIVNYKAEEENGEKFLDITILNDQNFIDSQKLDAADLLNKEIKLRWHYAPNSKATEINYLQQQINELKKELEKK
jgi:uncharacterized hydrophobic protein (TIGR00271 family)